MTSTYLDAARQRVVIYDGAFGTYLQLRDLTADDFGGPALEGCNEILVATRPDVIADLHEAFFEVGSEVVETDSFGSLPITLAEYGIADRAEELNRTAAELAREVADGFTTPTGPAGWPARSAPAPSSRRWARSASPSCATPTRSRPAASSTAASTCCSSRPSSTSSRPRPP